MKKRKSAARRKNAGARRIKIQNRVAMISISMVVCMLVVLLAFKEHSLQVKYQANENRKSQLEEEITTEEARTKDIEDMGIYAERRICGKDCKRKDRSGEGQRDYL